MPSFTEDFNVLVAPLLTRADKERLVAETAAQIVAAKDAIIKNKDAIIIEKENIVANLNTQITTVNAEVARLSALLENPTNEEYKTEIARLKAEVATLQTEVDRLNAEVIVLQAEIARLQAIIDNEPPPVEPPPDSNDGIDTTNSFTVHDTTVRPSETVVTFPVTLDRPADRTMTVKFTTKNGTNTYNTAWEPANTGQGQYIGNAGILTFQPGDKAKNVVVRLLGSLLPTQSIMLELSDFEGWPNHPYTRKSAQVVGDPTGAISRPSIAPTNALLTPNPKSKLVKFFDDNLITNFVATDTGFNNGKPCWRSRLVHGRTQPGNNELGFYTDPVIVPASNPFPIGNDGRRLIRAEYFPSGVMDASGKVIKIDYGDKYGQPFQFTAAILHSNTMMQISIGEYVEAVVKLEGKKGTWPAVWLLPDDYSWPPEIDILEGFFKAGQDLNSEVLTSTVHWTDEEGEHKMVPMPVNLSKLIGQQFNWEYYHTYGCYITDKYITFYVDEIPVCASPTVIDQTKKFSLLLNVAVGGLVGEPQPADMPASMSVESVRAYR